MSNGGGVSSVSLLPKLKSFSTLGSEISGFKLREGDSEKWLGGAGLPVGEPGHELTSEK